MIFVDTSFWIAHARPGDGYHADAARLTREYARARLVTSNLVLGETWSFLRRSEGQEGAFEWLDRTRADVKVAVSRIDEALEDEAWAWMRAHRERPYFFVKATSIALMRNLGLEEALAFGGAFAAAGLVELRA
ncbi:MAG: type II toxin-antitoxin system VapC family toxin [Gaiellaceae bacterium]